MTKERKKSEELMSKFGGYKYAIVHVNEMIAQIKEIIAQDWVDWPQYAELKNLLKSWIKVKTELENL